jgi:hypothetical protein
MDHNLDEMLKRLQEVWDAVTEEQRFELARDVRAFLASFRESLPAPQAG